MWTVRSRLLDADTVQMTLHGGSGVLSYRETTNLWCDQEEFRGFFSAAIRDSPFEAFFWETPVITDRTWDRPFECVLVKSASLSQLQPDPSSFDAHFSAGIRGCARFSKPRRRRDPGRSSAAGRQGLLPAPRTLPEKCSGLSGERLVAPCWFGRTDTGFQLAGLAEHRRDGRAVVAPAP